MPANPTHQGLEAQGRNWDLADAKEYVEKYGLLIIGQTYTTDDGKSRFVIRLEEGRLSPRMGFGLNGTAIIDWGDGSDTTTLTGANVNTVYYTQNHTYPSAGEYTISVEVSGEAKIFGNNKGTYLLSNANTNKTYYNSMYSSSLLYCFLSNIALDQYAFYLCCSMQSICISKYIVSIPNYAFSHCVSMNNIIVPNTVSVFGVSAFEECFSLTCLTIPNSVTFIANYSFTSDYSLQRLCLPESITYIGNYICSGCQSLHSILIPKSVTSLGSETVSLCISLRQILISDGITYISSYFAQSCYSLSYVIIPSTITLIDSYAFTNCYGLGLIKFESQIPPTIRSGVWDGIQTDCKILVPQGTIEAYKAAPNMPNPSTYTYEEY